MEDPPGSPLATSALEAEDGAMVSPGRGVRRLARRCSKAGLSEQAGRLLPRSGFLYPRPGPGDTTVTEPECVWERRVERRPLRLAGKGWQERGIGLGQLRGARTPVESFVHRVPAACQGLRQGQQPSHWGPDRLPVPAVNAPSATSSCLAPLCCKTQLRHPHPRLLFFVLVPPFSPAVPCTVASPDGSCRGPQRLPHY